MPTASVITFDFYGTLVQWHEGIEAAFREILVRHGRPKADPSPLIHEFRLRYDRRNAVWPHQCSTPKDASDF